MILINNEFFISGLFYKILFNFYNGIFVLIWFLKLWLLFLLMFKIINLKVYKVCYIIIKFWFYKVFILNLKIKFNFFWYYYIYLNIFLLFICNLIWYRKIVFNIMYYVC